MSICLERVRRQTTRALAAVFALTLICGCGTSTPDGSAAGGLATWGVRDLKNRSVDPFHAPDSKAIVLVFVRTDCPISNRYAPELERLYRKYSSEHVAFWLVYPDPTTSAKSVRDHVSEFKLSLPALLDIRHDLVKKSGATVTPEAAMFLPDGREVYRGRIDDRYVDFGKERAAPTKRDLQAALDEVLAGKPVSSPTTTAVGCYISDL
jgi:hypothetical protein